MYKKITEQISLSIRNLVHPLPARSLTIYDGSRQSPPMYDDSQPPGGCSFTMYDLLITCTFRMSPMYDLQFGEFGGYAANLANEMEALAPSSW